MGPLVSKKARWRDGASVAVGGDAPIADGYYVNPQMNVVREEIFGPVVVAQRFDNLDEVAKAANNTGFGLAAAIWTKDVSAMHTMAAKLKAGIIWGSCHAMFDAALPFGGYKDSGVGREQGIEGILAYTQTKSVIIQL